VKIKTKDYIICGNYGQGRESKKYKKEEKEMLNPVKCECCGKLYDYYTEPAEVQEGGFHICPECWSKKD